MKIDELPVEVLMTIFGFLRDYDEVSLVNKLFYGVVCKVNDSNISLHINHRTNVQCIQSMLTSHRKVSKVKIGPLNNFSSENVRQIVSVVNKFSATIKFLTFIGTCTEFVFLETLALTTNIEYLELRRVDFQESRQAEEHPSFAIRCVEALQLSKLMIPERCYASCKRNDRRDDNLNLKKLKSLMIVHWKDIFKEFVRLPVGVLTELRVAALDWNILITLIDRQPNIRQLKFQCYGGCDIGMEVFDKLTLESLEVDFFNVNKVTVATVAAILSKQTKLKSLTLLGRNIVNGVVMGAVANILELEKLEMNITETPFPSFAKIHKLKKLEDLKLEYIGLDHNDSTVKLEALDHVSMKRLNLVWRSKMSVAVIERLAKSSSFLEQLVLLDYRRSQLEVNTILCHFNFVKILEIKIMCEPLVDRCNYFNPKLKGLTVYFDNADLFYKHWLPELIASYPNISKLKLIFVDREPMCRIRPILDGFGKLETLTIKSNAMTIDDLNCLHDLKHNLLFVKLQQSRLKDDLNNKLRARFPVIKSDFCYLTMAVDRYTANNCNREKIWPLSPSHDRP